MRGVCFSTTLVVMPSETFVFVNVFAPFRLSFSSHWWLVWGEDIFLRSILARKSDYFGSLSLSSDLRCGSSFSLVRPVVWLRLLLSVFSTDSLDVVIVPGKLFPYLIHTYMLASLLQQQQWLCVYEPAVSNNLPVHWIERFCTYKPLGFGSYVDFSYLRRRIMATGVLNSSQAWLMLAFWR